MNKYRDHPRIRGEHTKSLPQQLVQWGSSPHSRGTLAGLAETAAGFRIIPAFAGNTLRRIRKGFVPGDHPRIRGEHVTVYPLTSLSAGSSPHSRGTLEEGVEVVKSLGIIPAFAGNTNGSRPEGFQA